MNADRPCVLEWRGATDVLVAIEPTTAEVRAAAPQLAAYYNDSHNRRMMAHEAELSVEDVVTYFQELRADGGRPFLLRLGDASGPLLGDADVRNIEDATGEVAIMIGQGSVQGRGLGTRFAVMVHAFAFRVLELRRIYVSIIPANLASLRLFEKLGYARDDAPEAREFADEESDVTMSLDRARFELARAAELSEIRIEPRVIDDRE